MKKFLAGLALVLVTVSLTVFVMDLSLHSTPSSSGFLANDFLTVTLEYAGPRELVGVDTYGPAVKAFQCERSAAAAVAQAHAMLPPGHLLTATCLHVLFKGPLGPDGAVVAQPFHGKPLEVIAVGVEFTHSGKFFGAEALHRASDVGTCVREAHEVIESNRRHGKIPEGNSLVIYCMPVPVIPKDASPQSAPDQDGSV